MRRFLYFLSFLLLLLSVSCNMTFYDDYGNVKDGDMSGREFWACYWGTDVYYKLDALNVAVGTYCIVYQEEGNTTSIDSAKKLAREFDKKIFPVIRDNFGDFEDVDGNGKVIILLLDIKDGYRVGQTEGYVAGYFDPENMDMRNELNSKSNRADMLYVDTYPGKVNSEDCYCTIAHEFEHLVNFSARNGREDEKQWINEGLATAAEYLYLGKHLSDRIDWYNADSLQTIRMGNNFYVWEGYWEEKGDSLSNYATVYLFFQWLRIHAANGSGIYKEIINHHSGDYNAVVAAAKKYIDSSLDSWEVLLRTWLAANFYGTNNNLFGYKGQIQLVPPYYSSFMGFQTWLPLAPGEAVYSLLAADRLLSNSVYIRYAGLKKGYDINTSGNYQKGSVLLTFNANPDIKDISETGYVCDIVASSPVQTLSGKKLPTLWQWDSVRAASNKTFRAGQDAIMPEIPQEQGGQ